MRLNNKICYLIRNCMGGAAVEFALVFPIFIVLLFGIIETSWAVFTKASLVHAVHLSARQAYANSDVLDSVIAESVKDFVEVTTGLSGVQVEVLQETINEVQYRTIRASYVFTGMISFAPLGVTLTGEIKIPVE